MLPTVADVLALEVVRRGSPRILAGADRLEAPVRWVHVIELAEAGHLLRGGELVLSTGIALPPDPDGLARYVAGLAAAGVSALAVELGSRYVRELPRALTAAALAHRLPLIVLERETQFIAITEAVHAQILDAQVAELRAAQRLSQIFTDLAMAGADDAEIVRQTSALAGAPVILADLAHRVLACAPAGQPIESLLGGFAARSRAAAVPGRSGYDAAAGWLVCVVGERGLDWGRLIIVLPGQPDAGLPVLAKRAATTLALARIVAGRSVSPVRAAHGSVLAAAAGPGYADPAELATLIAALGVPVAWPCCQWRSAWLTTPSARPRWPMTWPALARSSGCPRSAAPSGSARWASSWPCQRASLPRKPCPGWPPGCGPASSPAGM